MPLVLVVEEGDGRPKSLNMSTISITNQNLRYLLKEVAQIIRAISLTLAEESEPALEQNKLALEQNKLALELHRLALELHRLALGLHKLALGLHKLALEKKGLVARPTIVGRNDSTVPLSIPVVGLLQEQEEPPHLRRMRSLEEEHLA